MHVSTDVCIHAYFYYECAPYHSRLQWPTSLYLIQYEFQVIFESLNISGHFQLFSKRNNLFPLFKPYVSDMCSLMLMEELSY